jgi:hypothetical protein
LPNTGIRLGPSLANPRHVPKLRTYHCWMDLSERSTFFGLGPIRHPHWSWDVVWRSRFSSPSLRSPSSSKPACMLEAELSGALFSCRQMNDVVAEWQGWRAWSVHALSSAAQPRCFFFLIFFFGGVHGIEDTTMGGHCPFYFWVWGCVFFLIFGFIALKIWTILRWNFCILFS